MVVSRGQCVMVGAWDCFHYSIPSEQITFLKVLFGWCKLICTGTLAGAVFGTLGKEGWNWEDFIWVFLVSVFTLESHIATRAKCLRVA